MKKMVFSMLGFILTATLSMQVYAAPEVMPDGELFDAEYYSETYPDVADALGTDPAVLYQHYLMFGKAEGRQPYADAGALQPQDPAEAIVPPVSYGTGPYDLRMLLDSQVLVPTTTGFPKCDLYVDQILSEITTPDMDTYDKVKACYDYIINTSCYVGYGSPAPYPNAAVLNAATEGKSGPFGWDHTGPWLAEMILEDRTGVCDFYACAFAAMTRRIGLNCYCMSGYTRASGGGYTGHTWCEMILSGSVYYFDAELEDVIANGGKSKMSGNGAIKYQYFGKQYSADMNRYIRRGYMYVSFMPYTALTEPGTAVGYPMDSLNYANALPEVPGLSAWDSYYVRYQQAQMQLQTPQE